MSEPNFQSTQRKLRADAQRNRDRILEVAREAFAQQGTNVTLEDIVRLSGLGTGTLYRHFPTREALIEAVYLSEVEKLAAAERELAAAEPPVEALRQWMLRFVDFIAAKSVLKETLNAMVTDTTELYATSTELIRSAINALVERAIASGDIQLDFDPLDLLRALSGVVGTDSASKESARRLTDVLIAGIRAPKF
jgi:AcrR family transcriptional regulator